MTSRTRNFSILGIVVVLLAAAAFVIEDKSTKLGLDLKGGVELVYQGQPTPQVPTVTPQALDDALETIRKRTDALGVSEPEIQRSGRDQISIGLPDVQNSERAIQQVGYYATTGTFWAAYFAPADATGQTVYGLDTTSGIDVLHLDRAASARARTMPVSTADLLKGQRFGTPSSRWGFACPLPRAV